MPALGILCLGLVEDSPISALADEKCRVRSGELAYYKNTTPVDGRKAFVGQVGLSPEKPPIE